MNSLSSLPGYRRGPEHLLRSVFETVLSETSFGPPPSDTYARTLLPHKFHIPPIPFPPLRRARSELQGFLRATLGISHNLRCILKSLHKKFKNGRCNEMHMQIFLESNYCYVIWSQGRGFFLSEKALHMGQTFHDNFCNHIEDVM